MRRARSDSPRTGAFQEEWDAMLRSHGGRTGVRSLACRQVPARGTGGEKNGFPSLVDLRYTSPTALWRVVRVAEGARLEIVYTPKAYPGFKSQTLRQNSHGVPRDAVSPYGGVAEWSNAAVSKTVYPPCGYEGSNPSPSAIVCQVRGCGLFMFHIRLDCHSLTHYQVVNFPLIGQWGSPYHRAHSLRGRTAQMTKGAFHATERRVFLLCLGPPQA